MGYHPVPLGSSSGKLCVVVMVLLARARLWPVSGVPMAFGTDMKLGGISNMERVVMHSVRTGLIKMG